MDRELKAGHRFADKHGVGSLPGRRSETGESDTPQRVGHSGDASAPGGRDSDGLSRPHRDPVSYSAFPSLADWEDWMLAEGEEYLPLVGMPGGGPTVGELEKRSRMNHVFSFMRPDHVELLYWRHVEGMTLEAIARQEEVSRQAIAKRLNVAEAAFKTSFAEHWNDDITWEV
jgi:hypothetical protein